MAKAKAKKEATKGPGRPKKNRKHYPLLDCVEREMELEAVNIRERSPSTDDGVAKAKAVLKLVAMDLSEEEAAETPLESLGVAMVKWVADKRDAPGIQVEKKPIKRYYADSQHLFKLKGAKHGLKSGVKFEDCRIVGTPYLHGAVGATHLMYQLEVTASLTEIEALVEGVKQVVLVTATYEANLELGL